jgi:hypothetical protein
VHWRWRWRIAATRKARIARICGRRVSTELLGASSSLRASSARGGNRGRRVAVTIRIPAVPVIRIISRIIVSRHVGLSCCTTGGNVVGRLTLAYA